MRVEDIEDLDKEVFCLVNQTVCIRKFRQDRFKTIFVSAKYAMLTPSGSVITRLLRYHPAGFYFLQGEDSGCENMQYLIWIPPPEHTFHFDSHGDLMQQIAKEVWGDRPSGNYI